MEGSFFFVLCKIVKNDLNYLVSFEKWVLGYKKKYCIKRVNFQIGSFLFQRPRALKQRNPPVNLSTENVRHIQYLIKKKKIKFFPTGFKLFDDIWAEKFTK